MWRHVGTLQRWSLWTRVTITAATVVATHLIQIPLEQDIPGEPFLLFFLVVAGVTFAFGASAGFVGVAMTTVLSLLFFEPFGSLSLVHAADLVKIEVYAVLATACVFAFARLCDALSAATLETAALRRAEEKSSLLFCELTHGVANNFAAIAALITLKSHAVRDRKARAVLEEAIEQVNVMGRVHARLRAGDHEAWLDSAAFFGELCEDLNAAVARGRPVSIECQADSLPMCMDQAMSLGLIVNELVTNAMKHAFPDGRAGRIRVAFEAGKDELRLCVEDDGVGFSPRMRKGAGKGRDLVSGLADQLGGHLQVASTNGGSSFRLSVPFANPLPSTRTRAARGSDCALRRTALSAFARRAEQCHGTSESRVTLTAPRRFGYPGEARTASAAAPHTKGMRTIPPKGRVLARPCIPASRIKLGGERPFGGLSHDA